MYEQIIPKDILFNILYGAVSMLALTAACYLLLRQGNAFSNDITPPVRLRRWAAAFFAVDALGHLYYLPAACFTSGEAIRQALYVGAALDFLIFFPLAAVVMLVMLQDRRRPLLPFWVSTVPAALGVIWCLISNSDALVPAIYAYIALLGVILTIYLLRALRQYGRWLRDNYADLEHKEVWQTFAVMAGMLFIFGFYTFGVQGQFYEYAVQIGGAAMTVFLLWRIETLSDLSCPQSLPDNADEDNTSAASPENASDDFGNLLQLHCIDTQLYLQHDLTAAELAKSIGTNRTYLTQYFSRQGLNYNTYINDLRIRHFITLYRENIATCRNATLQQLVHDSGYRSYSTFSLAFKQRMGQTVTAWTRNVTELKIEN